MSDMKGKNDKNTAETFFPLIGTPDRKKDDPPHSGNRKKPVPLAFIDPGRTIFPIRENPARPQLPWQFAAVDSLCEAGNPTCGHSPTRSTNLSPDYWAPPLLKAAALMGLKSQDFRLEAGKILSSINTGPDRRRTLGLALRDMDSHRFESAAKALINFYQTSKIGSVAEEILLARALILSGKSRPEYEAAGRRRLLKIATSRRGSIAARLELARSRIAGNRTAGQYMTIARSAKTPGQLRVLCLVELARLVSSENPDTAGYYLATAAVLSKKAPVPRWFFHNPYRPEKKFTESSLPFVETPEILAFSARLLGREDWDERCFDWTLFLCNYRNPLSLKNFFSKKAPLGISPETGAAICELAAESSTGSTVKSTLFSTAANIYAGSENGPRKKALYCLARAALGNGEKDKISGKPRDYFAKNFPVPLELPPGSAGETLYIFCRFWHAFPDNLGGYDREWDDIFSALADRVPFSPRIAECLYLFGNALMFGAGSPATATRVYSRLVSALDTENEKRTYRVFPAGSPAADLPFDDAVTRMPPSGCTERYANSMLCYDPEATPMLQWLPLPAREKLAAWNKHLWRTAHARARKWEGEFFPPPGDVLAWFAECSRRFSGAFPVSPVNDRPPLSFQPWEFRRRYAMCLWACGRIGEAAGALSKAIDRLPAIYRSSAFETLVYDFCRMTLSHCSLRRPRPGEKGEIEETVNLVEKSAELYESIPSKRGSHPACVEYHAVGAGISGLVKKLDNLLRKEVKSNEPFHYNPHENQRFGRIETGAG